MTRTLEDDTDPTYTHFSHRAEFLAHLADFLSLDLSHDPSESEQEHEEGLVRAMGAILDHYLPLPGLLDPSLDEIVPPLMTALSSSLGRLSESQHVSASRLCRLGRVINWVVKVRGWKAIVPHFPSSISHLPILVSLLSPPTTPSTSSTPITPHHPLISSQAAWELRAVLLLWLALLLTVPFSLSALGAPSPLPPAAFQIDLPSYRRLFPTELAPLGERVVLLALQLLHRPGKEGAYAALVLARIYSRTDAVVGLSGFLDWAGDELHEGEREGEANFVASLLELLALLPGMLPPKYLGEIHTFTEERLLPHLRGGRTAASSGLVRKLAVKARGRWWIARLSGADMPEGLEDALDDFMSGLSDKDTIVRYSSAKYLARITGLLPAELSEQIVLATVGLFSGTEDEPVIETSFGTVVDPGGSPVGGMMGFGGAETVRGEARWHGVCLAVAEMARRGLLKHEAIGEAVKWVLKALTFDLRRASHSIGANVRDAAAYVLWSLSRACPPDELRPYADDMATGMICVACFDREVGVRRAASAAYQEGVGRLGLYPEGIDVLAKTDFYSVSVRRMAFTLAAPAVALHRVYRDRMRGHLHHITLRHWDTAMRTLGATALRDLLELGTEEDMDDSIAREIIELSSLDATSAHGALAALEQISTTLHEGDARHRKQAADMLKTACDLLTAALDGDVIAETSTQTLLDQFTETTMRRREAECHEAVARVFGRLSELRACGVEVIKLVGDLNSMRAAQRQSAALALGAIRYGNCPGVTEQAVHALLFQLEPEVKRGGGITDTDVLAVSPDSFRRIVASLLACLSDYTTDQRGDVGSWIRVAALRALGGIVGCAAGQPPATALALVDHEVFERVIGGMVRLGVEKLEPVRAASAGALRDLRHVHAGAVWGWEGEECLKAEMSDGYLDQQAWFASGMPLLKTRYRADLVAGLVLTIGSQVESVSRLALTPFTDYLLGTKADGVLGGVLADVEGLMGGNVTSNRVFVPCLTTVLRIVQAGVISRSVSEVLGDT
ncbi:hypothetical protein JCM24511_09773 [Saitozyma sp. JCM 24511]|nr:hypothetical protein JCM24511_09773 [Saitozyma sp. JCM 24511]